MDNLNAHKSSLMWKIMQGKNLTILYTPASTPQFSPIENMFGFTKKILRDYIFRDKKATAKKISEVMFAFSKCEI